MEKNQTTRWLHSFFFYLLTLLLDPLEKPIEAACRSETKTDAVPCVDLIIVGNKVLNEATCHKMMNILTDTIKEAAEEVNIGFIESVKTAFHGHELFLTDPYINSLFASKNAVHSNVKGYAKINQLIAAHLSSEQ